MKKVNYFFVLLCVACVFGSCAVGSYVPSTLNVGGISTQVVLSQANYRIVRNVEAVIDINNDNLRRADVEKSAFAELMRRYPLTGSQAYINVVLEEVRREKFGMGGGLQKRYQHVAIRATIIEFLQENGEPVKSVESPYNTTPQRVVQSEPAKAERKQGQVAEQKAQVVEQKIEEAELSSADISKLAKLSKNKYYIMSLLKSNNFDNNKKDEAARYFNIESLRQEKAKYSYKELQNKSADHDKVFEKFARFL